MTPEPLKGKMKYLRKYEHIDVKSAVEGCLEELIKEYGDWLNEDGIREIFKKWFHDVM